MTNCAEGGLVEAPQNGMSRVKELLLCVPVVVETLRLEIYFWELKQRRSWRQRNVTWKCNRVSAIFSQVFKVIMLARRFLTVLELNWNQRFRDKKTKWNICQHMLMSSTQPQNRSFQVVERTRTSAKCPKNEKCPYKACKTVTSLLPSSWWLLKLPVVVWQTTAKNACVPHVLHKYFSSFSQSHRHNGVARAARTSVEFLWRIFQITTWNFQIYSFNDNVKTQH